MTGHVCCVVSLFIFLFLPEIISFSFFLQYLMNSVFTFVLQKWSNYSICQDPFLIDSFDNLFMTFYAVVDLWLWNVPAEIDVFSGKKYICVSGCFCFSRSCWNCLASVKTMVLLTYIRTSQVPSTCGFATTHHNVLTHDLYGMRCWLWVLLFLVICISPLFLDCFMSFIIHK